MKMLFVGNIPPQATEEEITALFGEYGKVRKIELPRDIFSGKNRGFATIGMEGHEARAAIVGLKGKSFMGNTLKISDERPRFNKRGRR